MVTNISMQLNRFSIRTILAGAIFVIGNLAVVLVYFSGEVFQRTAIKHEQGILNNYAALEIREIIKELDSEAYRLTSALTNNSQLLQALADKKTRELQVHLRRQVKLYLNSRRKDSIINFAIYDTTLDKLAQYPASPSEEIPNSPICPGLWRAVIKVSKNPGEQNLSGFCFWEKQLVYILIAPVGDFTPLGFVQVVIDPISRLAEISETHGLPIRVLQPEGEIVYRSDSWPENPNGDVMSLKLGEELQGERIHIQVINNTGDLRASMNKTSYIVLVAAAVITLLVIMISIAVLQKTTVDPLMELTYQVQKISFDQSELGRTVIAEGNAEIYALAEGFNEMTAKLKESYANLQLMAFQDPLTGLPNRTLFHDRLQQAILSSKRSEQSFAVMIMDLDRFKEINDTVGHHVGDQILHQVGRRLGQDVRESDTIARLGGDEFSALFNSVDEHSAKQMASEMLNKLREVFEVNGDKFYIGASVGIALHPQHGDESGLLMQRADIAMYASKKNKQGYSIYNEELDRGSTSRLALMGDLRNAIETKEFELYYQPKIDLASNKVNGVEALVRWKRHGIDVSSPDVFIPILEQTGQIRHLTQWVLQEVINQYLVWKDIGIDIPIAINISTRDLQDPDIANRILTLLTDNHISPHNLELEITESSIMHDPIRALDTLSHISAMGVRVTIDDFGTGYSSLAYLKRLPAKTVKIDKSFVIGMGEDEDDAAIVLASVKLAHTLGLKVIAEGVENHETLRMLAEHGCDSAQGYFIARPMPPDDFSHWLKGSPWAP